MLRLLIISSIFFSNGVHAERPSEPLPEINHLLSFVKTSSCRINRNGTVHSGADAASHMQKKYDYFKKEITSTEKFIEFSAAKSTLTGKHYTVTCGKEKSMTTKKWLLEALKQYREKP